MNEKQRPGRHEIEALVVSSISEVLSQTGETSVETVGDATPLIGKDSVLESLGLVTLITDIEQRVEEQFGVIITMADERAMAREKSPFQNVLSLTDYVCLLVEEEGGGSPDGD